MRGIAIISPKGGVGKTTLCHLLALGASAWRGVPTYVFHTDEREPMTVNGRPYAYIDARDPKRLTTVVDSLLNNDGYCIIDGGGNRPEFDEWAARFVDLIIIPVMADSESIQQAQAVMKRIKSLGLNNARYILNMVSANKNERLYDFREFFSKLDSRLILGDLKRVSAVKRLGISDTPESPFPTPPANVNNLSRALHSLVDDCLHDMDTPKENMIVG